MLTSSRACTPPKRRLMPCTSSELPAASPWGTWAGAGPSVARPSEARPKNTDRARSSRSRSCAGRAGEADLAPLHEHGVLRERGGHVQGLLHDHDGDAPPHELLHDLDQLGDDRRREPERQLVDHQQPGPAQHRLADGEHLLLATRERARPSSPTARAGGEQTRRSRPSSPATNASSLRWTQPATRRLSATVSESNTPRPPGTVTRPRRTRAVGSRPVMSSPAKRTVPAVAGSSPPITRRIVDLPAPFVPSSATRSRSPTARSTPNSTGTEPVGGLDVAHHQQQGVAPRGRRRPGPSRSSSSRSANAASSDRLGTESWWRAATTRRNRSRQPYDQLPEPTGHHHQQDEQPGAGGQQLGRAPEEELGRPHVGRAEDGAGQRTQPPDDHHGEQLHAGGGVEAVERDGPQAEDVEEPGHARRGRPRSRTP